MSIQPTCIFCRIIDRTAPADILAENPSTLIFRPLDPVTDGHVLVIPNQHVDDAGENPLVSADVMRDAARYARTLRTDYNLITSAGPVATQTVFHLHLHVVPRRHGDGLTLPWTGQVRRADPA